MGLSIGVATGLITGAAFAYTDWCLNPGGIFHNQQGTDWGMVMETVTSWWLPVAGAVTALSWVVLFVMYRGQK